MIDKSDVLNLSVVFYVTWQWLFKAFYHIEKNIYDGNITADSDWFIAGTVTPIKIHVWRM